MCTYLVVCIFIYSFGDTITSDCFDAETIRQNPPPFAILHDSEEEYARKNAKGGSRDLPPVVSSPQVSKIQKNVKYQFFGTPAHQGEVQHTKLVTTDFELSIPYVGNMSIETSHIVSPSCASGGPNGPQSKPKVSRMSNRPSANDSGRVVFYNRPIRPARRRGQSTTPFRRNASNSTTPFRGKV